MRLRYYPYVLVRVACRDCPREGRYRLAALAYRFGPDTDVHDVLQAVSASCERWQQEHPGKQCQAYLPDLPPSRPPDLPKAVRIGRFRVIKGDRI